MADDKLLTVKEVGVFFGGGKPIAPSSVWRWVREGRIPKPVKIGGRLSRWRQSQCQEALDAMIEASDLEHQNGETGNP